MSLVHIHPRGEEALKRKLWKLDGQMGGYSGFQILYGGFGYGMMFVKECSSWIWLVEIEEMQLQIQLSTS